MAQVTSLTLVSQTPAASGNTTIRSPKQPAAGYYVSGKTLQTLSWSVTLFSGVIKIQASLVENPNEANDNDWFTIEQIGFSNKTETNYRNFEGNFVWVRVKVEGFLNGVIQFIKVSY
jgi:hypothetical protein